MDLSSLNPQQRNAVVQTEGPVLVLAGAGSGKTRVITHRIAHLLAQNVPARAILAVTFTNKAAAEMKERVRRLAGDGARGVTVSTFHAFGVRVVREQHEKLALPQKFAIVDSGDQAALVKRLLRDLKIDDKRFDVARVLSIISRRRMGAAEGHPGGAGSAGDGRSAQRGALEDEYELCASELLPRYELGLRAMGAVDFDDLLLLPLKLFRTDADVLASYQKRYRYILVDEYQDTNAAQLELLELLAGMRRNLCVVGDDDQSIYAWRGAQVRQIMEFDKRFPGCVEVFLEQNYRSNGNILDAANAIIGKNPGRKPKRLWTDKGRGPNLRLAIAPDDEQEAKYVSDEILRLSYEEKIPPCEIAVLYRTNAQARPLEEALRLAGVRYRVVGGTSLFDRKEVRDLLAYLRAALNPRDEISLLRIVNVPARGIGDQTIARVQEVARASRRSVWEVLREEERAKEFTQLIEKYGPRLSQRGFSEAARELVEEVRLFDEARRGAQSLPAQARKIEAIESLLRQLVDYEKRAEQRAAESAAGLPLQEGAPQPHPEAILSEGSDIGPSAPDDFAAGLPGYLARLALDSKDADGDAGDCVTLMTLHGAKGLEWRLVFLCGLEEGLLPHSGMGFDEPASGNLEEERRLCYVGFTRARERLVLTRAAQRLKRGKALPRTPSRFLDDVPKELLDVVDLSGPQLQPPKEVQQAKARNFFANMSELLTDGE